jgi:5-methyltetrahydrofolate--homocysteine methyltransferase
LGGGADILLVETAFDTLNAKAALAAIMRVREERSLNVPVMVSATISGPSGRLLSGQTIAAFCASVSHARPWSIGLNCSFGASDLLPHIRQIAASVPCRVSVHPNAGLPNLSGGYDDTPPIMADTLEIYMREGLLNVAGGCCGSTPAHIAAIAEKAENYAPRTAPRIEPVTLLAGLDILRIENEEIEGGAPSTGTAAPQPLEQPANAGCSPSLQPPAASSATPATLPAAPVLPVGERTNVAGSRKFLRLIKEENFSEAANIARETIAAGAKIIDVCMDDALLDAKSAMTRFLNFALSDPDIAAVPVMVDSSNWDVIEAGLKCVQGKALVNSISLKEGEAVFIRRARLARRYGAAIVVMLFDEEGQAASYERKTAVARRSYALLAQDGFPAEDIVFDPNVLSIATGIPEHDAYGLNFIRACRWIRENCPGAQISGGISNLSFSFRGNDGVRSALHAVFLRRAAEAGLTMAIVNPEGLIPCDDLPPDLRIAAEDVILCRDPAASEKLLSLAVALSAAALSQKTGTKTGEISSAGAWREKAEDERIVYALVNGIDTHIEADVLALKQKIESTGKSPLEIVEGPLMRAMREVGALFGEGKLFLPQVIRSARVMKKAVAVLEPFFNDSSPIAGEAERRPAARAKILLATVKGDVHDIGKNIVGVVLSCNGYGIIDLGVMVPCEQIIETALKEKVDIIGLSGLITPSLEEMITVARSMERQGFTIPLLIGGAAASRAHTAIRIAPEYSGPVVYSSDASQAATSARSLLSDTERPVFLETLKKSYREAAETEKNRRKKIISLEEARKNRFFSPAVVPEPNQKGIRVFTDYSLEQIIPYINWNAFLSSWDMLKSRNGEKETLLQDAEILLRCIAEEKLLTLKAVVGFFPVKVENEDVIVLDQERSAARFHFPRNRDLQKAGVSNPCLSDFIVIDGKNETGGGSLGFFALSAGFGVQEAQAAFAARHDEYNRLLVASLANTLAEAFAGELHRRVRTELWGYAPDENLTPGEAIAGKYRGIRPAFGYPVTPNHADKRLVFDLLHVEENTGITLTGSFMMIPEASVCGMYIAHPEAYYFSAGE